MFIRILCESTFKLCKTLGIKNQVFNWIFGKNFWSSPKNRAAGYVGVPKWKPRMSQHHTQVKSVGCSEEEEEGSNPEKNVLTPRKNVPAKRKNVLTQRRMFKPKGRRFWLQRRMFQLREDSFGSKEECSSLKEECSDPKMKVPTQGRMFQNILLWVGTFLLLVRTCILWAGTFFLGVRTFFSELEPSSLSWNLLPLGWNILLWARTFFIWLGTSIFWAGTFFLGVNLLWAGTFL